MGERDVGVWADVVTTPVRPADLLARTGAAEDGATLLFLGTVRNHNDGRPVSGMRYEAYESMAREVLAEIAREAAEILGSDRVAVVHRTGELEVGDVSVAVAVSSPHRAPAYRASRHVIEEIKKRLPVWKKEHYLDGEARWLEGVDPGRTREPAAQTGSGPERVAPAGDEPAPATTDGEAR